MKLFKYISLLTAFFFWAGFYSPVVWFMAPAEIKRHNNNIVAINVTGYKIRDCKFVPNVKYGQAKVKGVWQDTPVPFEFRTLDDQPDTQEESKPAVWELQSFGNWRFDISAFPDAEEVRLVAFHDCGWHGDVTSTYGGWSIENIKNTPEP